MSENLSPRTASGPDWEAIARYHAGESPADEARAVAGWLAANAPDAAMLATLDDAIERAIHADASAMVGEPDVEAALRTVKARALAARCTLWGMSRGVPAHGVPRRSRVDWV